MWYNNNEATEHLVKLVRFAGINIQKSMSPISLNLWGVADNGENENQTQLSDSPQHQCWS